MSQARVDALRQRLREAFQPLELEIRDDSHLHVGHAGAASGAGHFHVRIRSTAFAGQNLVARHRAVYAAVQDMLGSEVHALSIDAAEPASCAP